MTEEYKSREIIEQETCVVCGEKFEREQRKYEKPLFEKQSELNFPEKIWDKINEGKFQPSCSRCHHCR